MAQPADAAAASPFELDADGFEALRKLVVARHHHIFSKEDPIAMRQTVDEFLVTQTATKLERAQDAVLERFCHELERKPPKQQHAGARARREPQATEHA